MIAFHFHADAVGISGGSVEMFAASPVNHGSVFLIIPSAEPVLPIAGDAQLVTDVIPGIDLDSTQHQPVTVLISTGQRCGDGFQVEVPDDGWGDNPAIVFIRI